MFRGVRQYGFIPVLQSFGSSPLEIWEMKVEYGSIRRVTDEEVRALALELASTSVTTCYIRSPRRARDSLGIHMPYLVMILKNMNKYFTFEITILDDRNVHRRFRMSNFQKMNRVHHFSTSMPLCLNPGWNEIYFDLSDITRKAYKTTYVETTRIQIHANCRIRVIYFCDKIYEDKDIPQKFKMFLPTDHVCQKRRKSLEDSLAAKKSAESVPASEFEDESHLSEEEADEEAEMRLEKSLKSLAETTMDGASDVKSASIAEKRSGITIGSLEETDEEEEDEGEDEDEDGDKFGDGFKDEKPAEDEQGVVEKQIESVDLEDVGAEDADREASEG